MNAKRLLLGVVLAAFLALNACVVYEHGYIGFFTAVLSTLPGVAVMVDLAIALSLIAIWLWKDARQRGISALPYLVLGALLGSVGPLLYLLRTAGPADAESTRVSPVAYR